MRNQFFQSFSTHRSIKTSESIRKKLAQDSSSFNQKNSIFVELFSDVDLDLVFGAAAHNDDDDDEDGASVCRFCFTSDGEVRNFSLLWTILFLVLIDL